MIPSAGFILLLHYRQKFHSPGNYGEIFGVCQNVYTCFVDLKKAYDRVPREKLWGELFPIPTPTPSFQNFQLLDQTFPKFPTQTP